MSKKIAGVLIVVGIIMMVISGFNHGISFSGFDGDFIDIDDDIFDFYDRDEDRFENNKTLVKYFDTPYNLKINSDISEIKIINSNEFKIKYVEGSVEINVVNEEIIVNDASGLKDKFSNIFKDDIDDKYTVVIYLPTDYNKNINITSSIGDIEIMGNVNINELTINSDIGDVELSNGVVAENVFIKTNIGSVDIENITASNLNVECDLGEVDIEYTDFNDLMVKSNLGEVEVTLIDSAQFNIVDKQLFSYIASGNNKTIDIKTDVGRIVVR